MVHTKKIWLDLRFLSKDSYYSNFIYELVIFLIKSTPDYLYNIYLDTNFSNLIFPENSKKHLSQKTLLNIKKQISFWKKLEKENNDLVIFFNYKKPLNFSKKYIIFIPDLTIFHFPKNLNIFKKHINNFLFNKAVENSTKIICLNKKTSEELNDKLNIDERKINIIPGFFKKHDIDSKKENISINLKTKYNILWEYIIYNSWVWTEKNLDRILKVFKKIKENNIDISLLILDDKTIKNIEFRKQTINNKLTDKIFFIWEVNQFEKDYFYKNSLWLILPFLYNIFPFSANEALNHNTNIIASNLKNIKNIFWDKIEYFNETNTEDIYQKIINLKHKKNNYSEIFIENNIEKTTTDLKKIIESV